MPKLVWARSVFEPSADELARATAEQIRRDEREQAHSELIRKLRPALSSALPGGWWRGNRAFVGDFDIEDYCSERDGECRLGNLKTPCRGCQRKVYPFSSPSLVSVDGGWRWVGLDHQEPYTDYFFACGWCGTPMLFTVHVPQ